MAKIGKMPGLAVINGFKGVVDFYTWKGIAVARAWPRSPGSNRAIAVQAQWPAFSWAAKNWTNLPSYIQDAYNRMAQGTNLTGRDIFLKSYINGQSLTGLEADPL